MYSLPKSGKRKTQINYIIPLPMLTATNYALYSLGDYKGQAKMCVGNKRIVIFFIIFVLTAAVATKNT